MHNHTSLCHFITVRLTPAEDVLLSLREIARKYKINAGFIASSVGSLTQYGIRFAGSSITKVEKGCFETIALGGTLEKNGEHIHISIADHNGCTLGGHLMEGCLVRTTLELVIGILESQIYDREYCNLSGYDELVITNFSKE